MGATLSFGDENLPLYFMNYDDVLGRTITYVRSTPNHISKRNGWAKVTSYSVSVKDLGDCVIIGQKPQQNPDVYAVKKIIPFEDDGDTLSSDVVYIVPNRKDKVQVLDYALWKFSPRESEDEDDSNHVVVTKNGGQKRVKESSLVFKQALIRAFEDFENRREQYELKYAKLFKCKEEYV